MRLKFEVQVLSAFTVTDVLVFEPVQFPLQLRNTEPVSGVAETVTTVPVIYDPAPVTEPLPILFTARTYVLYTTTLIILDPVTPTLSVAERRKSYVPSTKPENVGVRVSPFVIVGLFGPLVFVHTIEVTAPFGLLALAASVRIVTFAGYSTVLSGPAFTVSGP